MFFSLHRCLRCPNPGPFRGKWELLPTSSSCPDSLLLSNPSRHRSRMRCPECRPYSFANSHQCFLLRLMLERQVSVTAESGLFWTLLPYTFSQQLEWPVILPNHCAISHPISASAASSCLQFPLFYWGTLTQPFRFSSGTPSSGSLWASSQTRSEFLFCVPQYQCLLGTFLIVCGWVCLPIPSFYSAGILPLVFVAQVSSTVTQ